MNHYAYGNDGVRKGSVGLSLSRSSMIIFCQHLELPLFELCENLLAAHQ